MKKHLYLLFIIVSIGLSSCSKTTPAVNASQQAAIDDAAIQTYITANKINATMAQSGLYYQVITPGTGVYPTSTSRVKVNYVGKLLDGTVFDSSNGFVTYLNSNIIAGWQIGIPFINVGGRILLIVPSALAYGTSANGSIPANSVLVFTIDLLGIN